MPTHLVQRNFVSQNKRYTMRRLEVLVVYPFKENIKVSNWKVTTVENVETALEKIQSNTFKVLAIYTKLDEFEKSRLKKLSNILDENIQTLEFDNYNELETTVKRLYWDHGNHQFKSVVHDNSFGLELSDVIKFK